ncbi:hypothetical protein F5H01DRAFT_136442 [Linnemannia elongata]|nr:hypothetical protein F5H01DRAFT_136442 [Linnemannia elongata]
MKRQSENKRMKKRYRVYRIALAKKKSFVPWVVLLVLMLMSPVAHPWCWPHQTPTTIYVLSLPLPLLSPVAHPFYNSFLNHPRSFHPLFRVFRNEDEEQLLTHVAALFVNMYRNK